MTEGLETTTLDKLYLEWSQITAARNSRERMARSTLADVLAWIGDEPSARHITGDDLIQRIKQDIAVLDVLP